MRNNLRTLKYSNFLSYEEKDQQNGLTSIKVDFQSPSSEMSLFTQKLNNPLQKSPNKGYQSFFKKVPKIANKTPQ